MAFYYSGRIVGTGERPMILLQDQRGGVAIDFIVSRDEKYLHLASGKPATSMFVRGGLPGSCPLQPQQGQSMWDAISTFIGPEAWAEVKSHPGRVLSREVCANLNRKLFDAVGRRELVVAGREMPLRADAPRTPFATSEYSLWHFDWINDTATPVQKDTGASYGQIVVFTIEDWAAVSRLSIAATGSAQAAQSPPKKGGGGNPGKMEDAFIREIIRQADSLDGIGSIRAIRRHMKEWCNQQYGDSAPSDRSIDRWLERFLPPGLSVK